MMRPRGHRLQDPHLAHARDPLLGWVALVMVFGLLVAIFGLAIGQSLAARRAAMLSFVGETYQAASSQPAAQQPVRVILAQ